MSVDIRTTLKRPATPGVSFEKIARAALGPKYELSLVICGDDLARRMNREYRKKSYKPNVLSFPLSTTEGEIFLNVRKAEREARQFGVSVRERTALLFVHGCFHLKGLDHGAKMESAERKLLKRFCFAAQ
jgi:probable rRNA maturation factor